MTAPDPMWSSAQARGLAEHGDIGGLIRLGREARGWHLKDLGDVLGFSASALSRMERRRAGGEIAMLRRAAQAVGMPRHVLATALGVADPLPAKVAKAAAGRAEEDPMRRRQLLTASLAVPAAAFLKVDDALAAIPDPAGLATAQDVTARLARARALFDAGDHARLVANVPDLLAAAHAAARDARPEDYGRLAACYDLTTEVLTKIGRHPASRSAADRATVYADLSGSPLAAASAARQLAILLRHQGEKAAAQRLTLQAASRIEATGLTRPAEAEAYAQMLCTCAYTAATNGDRATAHELLRDAEHAVRRVPDAADTRARSGTVNHASVQLYAVGVHWSLGDAGTALAIGRGLHPGQFPTAERRGRLHTDLARAWHQRGRPEETATALRAALREAPGEVRDRPSIRAIVTELHQRHPHAVGVRDLVAAVGRPA
ncbi:helix-turn-helix domain-containing protein [Streptodolium elevatio]|uniref:Helix-turn-helix domain-containing protein n=1 Tax=Streptodolium elevatio TaxID=3157996 RepID=A0ABV3DJ79_9ACTN